MTTLFTLLTLLFGVTQAHYNFERVQGPGINASNWQYMRKVGVEPTTGAGIADPIYVKDINTNKMRCNRNGDSPPPDIQSLPIKAGDILGFKLDYVIQHPGPLMAYMAKVPERKTAAIWDGSGKVFFKIFQDNITTITTDNPRDLPFIGVTWGGNKWKTDVFFNPPKTIPDGEYLFRVEHIGLHRTQVTLEKNGGAQFFISCAHLQVSGGGTGTPGPLVEFPGAYVEGEPGITLNVMNESKSLKEFQTSYIPPGPPVWVG